MNEGVAMNNAAELPLQGGGCPPSSRDVVGDRND